MKQFSFKTSIEINNRVKAKRKKIFNFQRFHSVEFGSKSKRLKNIYLTKVKTNKDLKVSF